jgi:hypothetical protein
MTDGLAGGIFSIGASIDSKRNSAWPLLGAHPGTACKDPAASSTGPILIVADQWELTAA